MFGVGAEKGQLEGQWKNLSLKNKQANTGESNKQKGYSRHMLLMIVLYYICLILDLTTTLLRLALNS